MRINWEKYGIEVPNGRSSGNIKVHCPQCRDQRSDKRDKSLSVNLASGEFMCHYCGYKGVAMEHTEDEKKEWMKSQSWYVDRPAKAKRPKKEYRKPKQSGNVNLSDKAVAWFAGRGISVDTLKRMHITEGMEKMPQKENRPCNTIQFNYYKDGVLVNTKFRTGDKCFKLVQGAERLPYNIDGIKGTAECIITEGEMDTLSFVEVGRTDCISVPTGANSNLEWLDDYIEDYFDDKKTIYIASDTDAKGVGLRDELVRRFGAERCRILDYGEDCKDANDLLQKHGRDAVIAALNDAREVRLEGVFSVSDFEDNLDALWESGWQKGVTMGYDNIDGLLSFETKRLCIVTGIPSAGKSEFIDEMAERLNIRYGWRFAYFSPENAPLAYHASKLIEKFVGKPFGKRDITTGEYVEVKRHLEEDFSFIMPEEDFKLESILDRARYLVRKKGVKALVIDPYNEIDSEQGAMSETQYINQLLKKLRTFAVMNDVLVILMAHPTKLQKNKSGVYEAPTLYDISGSANFYNKADFGITVHRDYVNQVTEVHVQKVKFRHLGHKGVAYFKYNTVNGRYVPVATPESFPTWDNTNHLRMEMERRMREADEAAVFDFERYEEDNLPF